MINKSKVKVAVLRGGPSSEFEVSLNTGAGVLKHLPEHYEGIDVFIDKKGVWHIEGVPIKPESISRKADVAFNAMHGEYGEDGTVQTLLENLGVPFTGSGSLASAIGMNKILSRKVFKQHGIKMPVHKVIEKRDYDKNTAHELWTTFIQPSVVKPHNLGSSVGVSIVRSLPEMQVALEKVFTLSDKAMIEEYIAGREATCGVLDDFRGQEVYPLFPIEIVPKTQVFYDYESKYDPKLVAEHICPGRFSKKESEEIQRLSILAHKAINARHYSRSDFIVHPKRGVYLLEINTLPGLTDISLIPDEMRAAGSSYDELLDHLLQLALKK